MNISQYEDMQITTVWCTPFPEKIATIAADITMKHKISSAADMTARLSIGPDAVYRNHMKILEHCVQCFLVTGISRALLQQIVQHRMSTVTSASQHYQNYEDYSFVIRDGKLDARKVYCSLKKSHDTYIQLKKIGWPKEEARQVLPNASAVNILFTINASSLVHFLNLRMCKRNVSEMQIFANKIHKACMEWWPEVFAVVGPDCKMHGKCRQGTMMAYECQQWAMKAD